MHLYRLRRKSDAFDETLLIFKKYKQWFFPIYEHSIRLYRPCKIFDNFLKTIVNLLSQPKRFKGKKFV